MSHRSKDESLPATGSRIPGFYRLTVSERRHVLRLRSDLSEEDLATWDDGGIDTSTANDVVENVVGVYALPLGVGLNCRVNDRDYRVPMAVEEPSVIAVAVAAQILQLRERALQSSQPGSTARERAGAGMP